MMKEEIGQYKNVYCKISGMITEADYKSWTTAEVNPYMDLVLEAFGSERLMYGSDWPVCLVAGNYGQVKNLVTDFIATLSPSEQSQIMAENAVKFYQL